MLLQLTLTLDNMMKKGKKKPKIVEYDLDSEMVNGALVKNIEILYEVTKAITIAELDFKLGQMFQMLKEKKVPEAGLEDLALYENIL